MSNTIVTAVISPDEKTRYLWGPSVVPIPEIKEMKYAFLSEILDDQRQGNIRDVALIVMAWHFAQGPENANVQKLRQAFPDAKIIFLLDKKPPDSQFDVRGADTVIRMFAPGSIELFENAVRRHLSEKGGPTYQDCCLVYASPVERGSFNPPRTINGTQPR